MRRYEFSGCKEAVIIYICITLYYPPVYRIVNVRHEIAFHGSFLVIGRSIVVVVLFSAP